MHTAARFAIHNLPYTPWKGYKYWAWCAQRERKPAIREGPAYQAAVPAGPPAAPRPQGREADDPRAGVPGPTPAEALALAAGPEKDSADALPLDARADPALNANGARNACVGSEKCARALDRRCEGRRVAYGGILVGEQEQCVGVHHPGQSFFPKVTYERWQARTGREGACTGEGACNVLMLRRGVSAP